MLRLTLAWLHLVALGMGLWAVFARGEALKEAAREQPRTDALHRAFKADAQWGVAAALWLVTGLWRYLGSTEKSTDYYNFNHIFLAKMTLFVALLVLEILPMMTLIRWRQAMRSAGSAQTAGGGSVIEPEKARTLATISYIEGAVVTVMIFIAVAMARGYGARS